MLQPPVPTHNERELAELRTGWVWNYRVQPLSKINAYFGERLTFYFAWIGHYTGWLLWPALIGAAIFGVEYVRLAWLL